MKRPVDILFTPTEPGELPYWRIALRGCSQPGFQSNELTGLCILAAALIVSPIAAAYMLAAAIMAPAGRMLLGDRRPALESGLAGLNPGLIALSIPTFFQTAWTDVAMWGVLLAAVASTVILTRICLATLPLPTLVAPFLITFWAMHALAPQLGFLNPVDFGNSPTADLHPIQAVLSGLGEAAFSPNMWSGLLIGVGIFQSNWRHGILAVCGAIIGTVVSYHNRDVALDPAAINLGLYGFNSVLAALSVFVFCGGRLRLAILGAIVAAVLVPVISTLGVQALSAPFVVATWLIIALGWIENNWFGAPSEDGAQRNSKNTAKAANTQSGD